MKRRQNEPRVLGGIDDLPLDCVKMELKQCLSCLHRSQGSDDTRPLVDGPFSNIADSLHSSDMLSTVSGSSSGCCKQTPAKQGPLVRMSTASLLLRFRLEGPCSPTNAHGTKKRLVDALRPNSDRRPICTSLFNHPYR